MHGCLLIDKEEGYTSQAICHRIKKMFNLKKVGHCGTLDPFATGLLIVGINEGTKILSFLETQKKEYQAVIVFGKQTDTGDCTGKIINQNEISELSLEKIHEVLNSFVGKQAQIPPMYSAIKVHGKKLYEYARKNQDIERKSREIEIFSIRLIEYTHPYLTIHVCCSKGTYIRRLGEDIAQKLNTFGYLQSLKRLKIGVFDLKNAQKIQNLTMQNLHFIHEMVPFSTYVAKKELLEDIKNGKKVQLDSQDSLLLIVDDKKNSIAIYALEENQIYRCLRGFYYENYPCE